MGIVVALLVVAVGQSFTSVPMLFAKPSYYGQFTDSGGLHKGDRVRIAGLGVGTVEGLKIDGDHIVVKFSIGTNTIGTESRLASAPTPSCRVEPSAAIGGAPHFLAATN